MCHLWNNSEIFYQNVEIFLLPSMLYGHFSLYILLQLCSLILSRPQQLEFFKQVGEVKFVRMAGDETQPTRFAFVEFADQNSVPRALAFNGVMFGDRPLK